MSAFLDSNVLVYVADSMMIAAAERANCDEIWSEDLSDGQSYFGVVAHNPFKVKS